MEVNPGRVNYEAFKLITEKKKPNGVFKKKIEQWKSWCDENAPYLKEKVPTLFNMIVEKECDIDKLNYMLHMYSQVYNGQKSQENAEKEVGQRFANEYVKPLVDKLENDKKDN